MEKNTKNEKEEEKYLYIHYKAKSFSLTPFRSSALI